MRNLIVPGWVTYDPLHARRRWVTFQIRAAALYHNEAGSVKLLSLACGLASGTLHLYIRMGLVPPSICERLEKLSDGTIKASRINHPEK
jgi:hypothetical protein